ncbi:MAG: hypothetical protein ABI807_14945 [Sporichthyaceae bacterium]
MADTAAVLAAAQEALSATIGDAAVLTAPADLGGSSRSTLRPSPSRRAVVHHRLSRVAAGTDPRLAPWRWVAARAAEQTWERWGEQAPSPGARVPPPALTAPLQKP